LNDLELVIISNSSLVVAQP